MKEYYTNMYMLCFLCPFKRDNLRGGFVFSDASVIGLLPLGALCKIMRIPAPSCFQDRFSSQQSSRSTLVQRVVTYRGPFLKEERKSQNTFSASYWDDGDGIYCIWG